MVEGKSARSAPSGTTTPASKKPKPEPASTGAAAPKPAPVAKPKPAAKRAPAAKAAAPKPAPVAKPKPAATPAKPAQTIQAAPVPSARRYYKRHEIKLADGGKLVLEVDGSILRFDAAGVATATWQPGDPDWDSHALRFGVKPQPPTARPDARDQWR